MSRSASRSASRTTSSRLQAPWLLIAPSLVLALFIISYPIFNIVWQSLHDVSRFGAIRDFTGAQNFITIFTDPAFLDAARRTIVWTVCVVGGTVIISVPVALVLNQDFYGRGVARTIIMLPWSVSLTMTAVVWRWAFNDDYGMVNVTLQKLGLISGPIHWLATPELAFPVEIAVGILVSIPFTVTILLGGLSSVPGDIYEAARMDGASAWQQFRNVTLPGLRAVSSTVVLLGVIWTFNQFAIIFLLFGNTAPDAQILVTWAYYLGFGQTPRDYAQSATYGVLLLSLLIVFTSVYRRWLNRNDVQAAI
jgi:multiple sugar transport system permease protein